MYFGSKMLALSDIWAAEERCFVWGTKRFYLLIFTAPHACQFIDVTRSAGGFFRAATMSKIAVPLSLRCATAGTVHSADLIPLTAGARQGRPVRFDLARHLGAALH